jgi:hypothetical protein
MIGVSRINVPRFRPLPVHTIEEDEGQPLPAREIS